MRIYFISFLLTFFCVNISAQDIHFSQFNLSPLNLNPALTGSFDGDYRFIGNHRNQWSSVSTPYSTFALSVEKNKFLNNKLSLGLQINQDKAGDSKFSTFQVNFSGAYKTSIIDSSNIISSGFQLGFTNRHIDFDPLSFDAQYTGHFYDANLPNNENFSTNSNIYPNINLGFCYKKLLSNNNSIQSGFSIYNLNMSNQSFYDENIKLDPRFTFHSTFKYSFDSQIKFLPSVAYIKQGKHSESIISLKTLYILTDFRSIYRTIWGGVSYRNKDAIFISAGIDYDALKIGVSYDVNLSKLLPASIYRGGFEFAIIYIIKKEPITKEVHRICPDYL